MSHEKEIQCPKCHFWLNVENAVALLSARTQIDYKVVTPDPEKPAEVGNGDYEKGTPDE